MSPFPKIFVVISFIFFIIVSELAYTDAICIVKILYGGKFLHKVVLCMK